MLIFTQQVPKIHGANPNTHSTVNSWVIQFFHHFNSLGTRYFQMGRVRVCKWYLKGGFVEKLICPVDNFEMCQKNIFWWAVFLLEIWTLMDSKRTVLLPSILQNVYKQELEPCQAEWFLLCIALWWEYNLLVLIWTFIYVPHIVKKEIIL